MLRTSWLPWCILVVGLGLTWQVWDHEHRSRQLQLKTHFDYSQLETISRIEQRMDAYELLLRGVQAQYATREKSDRNGLHDYVNTLKLDANFSGVQAISHVEWVPAEQKQAHLVKMQRLGFSDYSIYPEGSREAYAPVVQREPSSIRNRNVIGFDAWSDPVRRLAMERARDSGMAAISGKVRLNIDTESVEKPGFVMYLPIYASNQPNDTLAQRRANLVGWFSAAFRMSDLMASLYGHFPPGINFSIHDGIELSDQTLLYRSDPSESTESATLSGNEYLVIGGQTWTLSMMASSDFVKRFGRNDASLIAWSGVGLSLLLAFIARLLISSRARALTLAQAMTKELTESERRWAFALEGAGDGVWDWNLRTRAVVTSKRFKEIDADHFGTGTKTIEDWEARIHPMDYMKAMAIMRSCLESPPNMNSNYLAEYRIRCHDNQWKWVLTRGMVVEREADGRPLRMIGTISDISERKAIEEKIRHMAQHDALTDLPNRNLFTDRLQCELEHAKRHKTRLALIFLDLDKFKPVNDNYGHAVGDQLLQLAAKRIQAVLRAEDTVGRIGGDEFVVLVSHLTEPADAFTLAEKIRLAVRAPYRIENLEITISCSLGVAVYPEDGLDVIELSKCADSAMYRAKESGSDNVQGKG